MSLRQKALAVWAAVIAWIAFVVASLSTGWLNRFYFDTSTAHVQGIDFFPVARAFLLLADGRSQFDTFHSGYGPYATWYLYHPFLAVIYGPLVAFFEPWHGYAMSTAISLALLAYATYLLTRLTENPVHRALIALVMMGSFPGFILLYSGNVQALIILSLTMILVAVESIRRQGVTKHAERLLMIGLLISLFSKPFVLAMVPLLLLVGETRRAALRALGVYVVVSFLCIVVPGINPVSLTWAERAQLFTHVEAAKQTMNVYTNGMNVTLPMQDNSIHWFSMVGLTDFRLQHVDVLSLPVLLDALSGTHTPASLYRVPLLLILEVTLLVALIRDKARRLDAAITTLMAGSLLLFVSYGLVWEYHYAAVMPLLVLFLLSKSRTWLDRVLIVCAATAWFPGLYLFLQHNDMTLLSVQDVLRAERVVPVATIFVLLLVRATVVALQSPTGLRFFTKSETASVAV